MKRLDELGVSPAPWTYNAEKPAVYGGDGSYIADCDFHYDHRRDAADARLTAAAPNLYEALRLVLDTIDALGFKPMVESDPLAVAIKCGEKALKKAGGGGMKKKDEAFQTLYVVEVKDRMRDPWRVKSAHERRGDAEDAACRTLMIGRVDDLRITKWARKEAAE